MSSNEQEVLFILTLKNKRVILTNSFFNSFYKNHNFGDKDIFGLWKIL